MNDKYSNSKKTSEVKPNENTLLALKLFARVYVSKPKKVKVLCN